MCRYNRGDEGRGGSPRAPTIDGRNKAQRRGSKQTKFSLGYGVGVWCMWTGRERTVQEWMRRRARRNWEAVVGRGWFF